MPTGVLGGTPTGSRTTIGPNEKPVERRSYELENECADGVAHNGYRVHQNPTRRQIAEAASKAGDLVDPDKKPDYLFEGYVFDCYAPTALKPVRGVWNESCKKVDRKQTQRVVLNLKDWRGDLEDLKKQFDDWPHPGLKELIVLRRDGTIVQLI